MCGICGIYALSEKGKAYLDNIDGTVAAIAHRGPDHFGIYRHEKAALAHTRLSILDVSEASHQPFFSDDKQQVIAFNGEVFNYEALGKGLNCRTSGDVEVLLKTFHRQGPAVLDQLNGFFAFSFYNQASDELYLVRDRLGIKPLYYYLSEDVLVFASEIKAILRVVGPQKLNARALHHYFRFNYITGPESIFETIFQLPPGHYMEVKQGRASLKQWYNAAAARQATAEPVKELNQLLDDAVGLRLHADVPVGCFLSGGVDSSIISALAARRHNNLHTFSIGFKDEPFFDETRYAEQVAAHIGSKHHTFKLGNNDLLSNLGDFLNSIDEPFADSSALNVYILSQYTREHVKVALSGDGADELFMGYNKHRAEWLVNHSSYRHLRPIALPLLSVLPKSRHGFFSNRFRQLDRFYTSSGLSPLERYASWAGISTPEELRRLLFDPKPGRLPVEALFAANDPYRATNLADLQMVLADDMLVKVDRMSMRHGIEIRNPFLDYRVVAFALSLPVHEKITKDEQKVILRKAFAGLLPEEIFRRRKKGFEVPLLKWFNKELRQGIENNWLSEALIREQGLFNYEYVYHLKKQLFSSNPGDAAAKVWALIVFQQWYANHKDLIDA